MFSENVACRNIGHSKWKHLLPYYLQNSPDQFGFDAPTAGSENSFRSQVPAARWMMQRANFVQGAPRDSGECPECEQGALCATAASLSSCQQWCYLNRLAQSRHPTHWQQNCEIVRQKQAAWARCKLPGASVSRYRPSAEGRRQRNLHQDVIQLRFKYQNPVRKA